MRGLFPKIIRYYFILLLPCLFFTSYSFYAVELTQPTASAQITGQSILFKPTLPQGSLVALSDATRVRLPAVGEVRVID